MTTEYICLNPKCKQIQTIDEIYDEEYNCLHCSYCLGKDFFEHEVYACDECEAFTDAPENDDSTYRRDTIQAGRGHLLRN